MTRSTICLAAIIGCAIGALALPARADDIVTDKTTFAGVTIKSVGDDGYDNTSNEWIGTMAGS